MLLRITTLCVLLLASQAKKSYEGDKVVKVDLENVDQWEELQRVLREIQGVENVDFLKYPDHQNSVFFRVSEVDYDVIESLLADLNMEAEVTIDNIQTLIDDEAEQLANHAADDIVGTYATYDDILTWMTEMTQTYPELLSLVNIGSTYEGRPMRLLRFSLGDPTNKYRVYVEGGMHAREWVSPSTVIYITDQMIQGYAASDPTTLSWLAQFEFYVIPVANPDGYDYCFTTERLWRKNRTPILDSSCVGTDLNRNWDYHWGEAGASADPCDNTYMGPRPGSEGEVRNIVNWLLPQSEQFILYMAYHSWGQQFFTRWDYTNDTVPPDNAELMDLAVRTAQVITDVHDVYYEPGRAPVIMYAFSGSSADWARGVAGMQFAYLEELRDNGTYSFTLPPDQIIPTGEENWAGFQYLINQISTMCSGVSPPDPCPYGN